MTYVPVIPTDFPALSVERPTGVRDEPIPHADALRQGMARIDANDGGGAYTISELWWDADQKQWTAAEAAPGLVEVEARDWRHNAQGQADQHVRFWETRAIGGHVCRFIDAGGTIGSQKITAFCAHYAGYDETTAAFFSVPGCLHSLLQIGLDVRLCSDNGLAGDHPGSAETRVSGGTTEHAWANAIAAWSGDGDNWIDLAYCARDADGNLIGTGAGAISNFHIEARVTAAGVLELRVRNSNPWGGVFSACVIVGAVWVAPCGAPPGAIEFGNGEDHEKVDVPEGDSVWGDGIWEPRG